MDKQTLSASLFSADKPLNPYTGLVTVHDVTPMLPIEYNLAKTYRYNTCMHVHGTYMQMLCVLSSSRFEYMHVRMW